MLLGILHFPNSISPITYAKFGGQTVCIMVDLKIVNMQSAGRVKLSGDFLSKFMTSRRSFFFEITSMCVLDLYQNFHGGRICCFFCDPSVFHFFFPMRRLCFDEVTGVETLYG